MDESSKLGAPQEEYDESVEDSGEARIEQPQRVWSKEEGRDLSTLGHCGWGWPIGQIDKGETGGRS